MPYLDRAQRLAHAKRYSRAHYHANRQLYIDRSAVRKRFLRDADERRRARQAQGGSMTLKRQPCPKCHGTMIQDEVGGRRYWECESQTCLKRILLDKPNPHYVPPRESTMTIEAPTPPAPAPERRPTHTAEGRRRISIAMRARHAAKRQAREAQQIREAAREAARDVAQGQPGTRGATMDRTPTTPETPPGDPRGRSIHDVLCELQREETALGAKLQNIRKAILLLQQANQIINGRT